MVTRTNTGVAMEEGMLIWRAMVRWSVGTVDGSIEEFRVV